MMFKWLVYLYDFHSFKCKVKYVTYPSTSFVVVYVHQPLNAFSAFNRIDEITTKFFTKTYILRKQIMIMTTILIFQFYKKRFFNLNQNEKYLRTSSPLPIFFRLFSLHFIVTTTFI